jgi:MFS transporter, UMF1 family
MRLLKVPPKEVIAWAMYDFANSTFATIVATSVFSAYFVGVIAGTLQSGFALLLLTLTATVASLIVVCSAPIVGAIADIYAIKKRILLISTIGCVACVALLSFAGPGTITYALALLGLAYVFYGTGENLIAAFLPEIASPQAMGRVSAFGWMVGYFGALGLLGICFLYANAAQAGGLPSTQYVPNIMLITAASFAVASAATFLGLNERAKPKLHLAKANVVALAFGQLRETIKSAEEYRDLFKFLRALFVFSCGTTTVVSLAAVYAQEAMGFQPKDIMLLVAVVNITGAIGSIMFGFIQDRIGSIKTLHVTLMIWIVGTTIAALSTDRAMFWLAANLIGVAMGASLSTSRAVVGRFSPENRCAEFFGLWGLAIKLATAAGPLSFALLTFITNDNYRAAIFLTIIYFAAGMWLLRDVNEERGLREAERGI